MLIRFEDKWSVQEAIEALRSTLLELEQYDISHLSSLELSFAMQEADGHACVIADPMTGEEMDMTMVFNPNSEQPRLKQRKPAQVVSLDAYRNRRCGAD